MADYKVQARHEIAIPTPAGGWTWGALRAHVTSSLLTDVPDDYVVQFNMPEHPNEIRLLEPLEPTHGPAAPIEYLGLVVRSYNILKREGIDTVGQLMRLTPHAISQFRNADVLTVEDCRTKLAAAGFHWPNT